MKKILALSLFIATSAMASGPGGGLVNPNISAGAAATITSIGGFSTNYLGQLYVVPWNNQPAGVTNNPLIFGPWLGPDYVQQAINALPYYGAYNAVSGGRITVISTNICPSTLVFSNISNWNASFDIEALTRWGGALICQTNPCIRVVYNNTNVPIQFTMRDLIVSTFTNQMTNLMEVLGGVARLDIDDNWFGPWQAMTNNAVVGLQGLSSPSNNGGNLAKCNLVGLFLQDGADDLCVVNGNSFLNCNAGVSISIDHLKFHDNFFTACGSTNDYPSSNIHSMGANIILAGGLQDWELRHSYFYQPSGPKPGFSYLINQALAPQVSIANDQYEGTSGMLFTNGASVSEIYANNGSPDTIYTTVGGNYTTSSVLTNNGYYGGHHLMYFANASVLFSAAGLQFVNALDRISDAFGTYPLSTNVQAANGTFPAAQLTGQLSNATLAGSGAVTNLAAPAGWSWSVSGNTATLVNNSALTNNFNSLVVLSNGLAVNGPITFTNLNGAATLMFVGGSDTFTGAGLSFATVTNGYKGQWNMTERTDSALTMRWYPNAEANTAQRNFAATTNGNFGFGILNPDTTVSLDVEGYGGSMKAATNKASWNTINSTTLTITNTTFGGKATWSFTLKLVEAATGNPVFQVQIPGDGVFKGNTNLITPAPFSLVGTLTNEWDFPVGVGTTNTLVDLSGTGASITVISSQITF